MDGVIIPGLIVILGDILMILVFLILVHNIKRYLIMLIKLYIFI